MIKLAKKIVKFRKLIILVFLLLLIPSAIGMEKTKINYDVLCYLPEDLETIQGQNILMDEFGMGAFSMVVVENMDQKDVVKLENQLQNIDHVKDVLWYDDALDISVPVEMLPADLKDAFFNGDATMLVALLDSSTSSDETMQAITEMQHVCEKQCFISGMSAVVTDTKELSEREVPIYVLIAVALSLIVLALTMDSWVTPIIFLCSIGAAILYNLGSNIFLGEISYITKALTAVLQLGVTMDYSIFLLNSYEDNKVRFNNDKERAMAHAISNTFKSVLGSSITTVAGFAALCFMSFSLGMDIGIVMSKGVLLGVICCVTLLPALVLELDKVIEKTKHKPLLPDLNKASDFITKHCAIWLLLFLVLLFPAIYGNNHTSVYYNIDKTLPETLKSSIANKKLEEDFGMNGVYMVLCKTDSMTPTQKGNMLKELENVDGVTWAIGMESMVGPGIPDEMIPKDIKSMLQSDEYELQFICSDYKVATDEMNAQVAEVGKIVKSYDPGSMVIGEAPLTKDLVDVTDVDFKNVSIASIFAIFVIIAFVFKSLSLPIILVAVIEFAINVNMGIPFYTGTQLPFVASIVIGTIQLGATVDYAILMTSKYQKARSQGESKKTAIGDAHRSSMKSILISGCTFFAATFGVGLYSEIDMISSICTLLSRGAIISMLVVILVLPSFFMMFDGLICKTSIGFLKKEEEKNENKDE